MDFGSLFSFIRKYFDSNKEECESCETEYVRDYIRSKKFKRAVGHLSRTKLKIVVHALCRNTVLYNERISLVCPFCKAIVEDVSLLDLKRVVRDVGIENCIYDHLGYRFISRAQMHVCYSVKLLTGDRWYCQPLDIAILLRRTKYSRYLHDDLNLSVIKLHHQRMYVISRSPRENENAMSYLGEKDLRVYYYYLRNK